MTPSSVTEHRLSISEAMVRDRALLNDISKSLDRLRVGQAPASWCSGGSLNSQADAMGNIAC